MFQATRCIIAHVITHPLPEVNKSVSEGNGCCRMAQYSWKIWICALFAISISISIEWRGTCALMGAASLLADGRTRLDWDSERPSIDKLAESTAPRGGISGGSFHLPSRVESVDGAMPLPRNFLIFFCMKIRIYEHFLHI